MLGIPGAGMHTHKIDSHNTHFLCLSNPVNGITDMLKAEPCKTLPVLVNSKLTVFVNHVGINTTCVCVYIHYKYTLRFKAIMLIKDILY